MAAHPLRLSVYAALAWAVGWSWAAAADDTAAQLAALQRSVLQLQNSVSQLQQETAGMRGELERLQHELESRAPGATAGTPSAPTPTGGNAVPTAKTSGVETAAVPSEKASPQEQGETLDTVTPEARGNYDLAYAHVTRQDLPAAERAFRAYLQRYPHNQLTPNAWYWLGQIQFNRHQDEDARVSFLSAAQYPGTPKRAESIYKVGLIYKKQGETEKAARFFKLVVDSYPADDAVTVLARKELDGP